MNVRNTYPLQLTVPAWMVIADGTTAKEARERNLTLPDDIPDCAVFHEKAFQWVRATINLHTPLKRGDKVKILASTWDNGLVGQSPIGETGNVRHVHPEDGSIYVHLPDKYLWFNRSDLELVPAD